MRTRLAAAAVAVAATLTALTACSSDDSSDQAAAPPAAPATATAAADDTAALTTAVRAYSAAYFTPDGKAAYALMSARCRASVPESTYTALVTATAAQYGHQDIKTLKVDEVAGDLARVTYTYTVPRLSQTGQPWTREGGTWHYDAC